MPPTVTIEFEARGGRSVADAIDGVEARARRSRQRTASDSSRARTTEVAAERAATSARIREILTRENALTRSETKFRAAVADSTKLVEAATGKKIAAGSREARQVEQLAAQRIAAEDRVVREMVRTQGRGQAEIERIERKHEAARQRRQREATRTANAIVGAVGAVGGAVYGAAGAYHAQVQDARRGRAVANRELNGALIQAGVTQPAEIAAIQRKVAARALDEGVKYEDLVNAINVSQSSFNSLGGADPLQRASKLNDILDAASFANSMHTDMAQTAKFQGMLAQNGIGGEMQRDLVQRATQLSFMGSVEIGDALKSGLGPMMKYINTELAKLGPGATKEQRDGVYGHALLDAFAQQQVQASVGNTVRWSGNRFANLDSVLQNEGNANKLHAKFAATFKEGTAERALVDNAFVKGDNGSFTLRKDLQNPLAFAGLAAQLFKGDPAKFRNVVGAGGAGVSGQAFLKPDADLLSALIAPKDGGGYVYETIGELVRNSKMSPEQIQAAKDITQSEELTKLNKADEARAQALTDNTNALNNLSNRFGDWLTAHPGTVVAAGAAAPIVGTVAAAAGKRFLTSVIGGAAPAAAAGGGGAGTTAAGVGGAGAGGTAAVALTTFLAAAGLTSAGIYALDELGGRRGRAKGSSHDTLFEGETYTEIGKIFGGNDAAGNVGAAQSQMGVRARLAQVLAAGGEQALAGLSGDKRAEALDLLRSAGVQLNEASISKLAEALGVKISENPPKVSFMDVMHASSVANMARPTNMQ